MKTRHGHLTYCTNIHEGADWTTHFQELKKHFPSIRTRLSPNAPMGLGLRLSDRASRELCKEESLAEFQNWLKQENAYVFTMNGFPYGEFHKTVVKDDVHRPDWTSNERLEYTLRLFKLLSALVPADLEGGISTSPLSYRHWFTSETALNEATEKATVNLLKVVEQLICIHQESGKILHLDIEPEPDGILETGREFIDWYQDTLLPIGTEFLGKQFGYSREEAEKAMKRHLQLCYDVCHFALGYEDHAAIIQELKNKGIQVGKIQISAALKATLPKESSERAAIKAAFNTYNEPVYLHQVIAKKENGELVRYRDLPAALQQEGPQETEWRAHFHVPIFLETFDALSSTQADIQTVLQLHQTENFTQHLEVETYTWAVLPSAFKVPLHESIQRELLWVNKHLSNH